MLYIFFITSHLKLLNIKKDDNNIWCWKSTSSSRKQQITITENNNIYKTAVLNIFFNLEINQYNDIGFPHQNVLGQIIPTCYRLSEKKNFLKLLSSKGHRKVEFFKLATWSPHISGMIRATTDLLEHLMYEYFWGFNEKR